ncbi:MAG: hypothetical protein WC269_02785 [Candidatus Gracilibacteria bacterium]|jgi:hypothetical protein
MGVGGKKPDMHEIAETRFSGQVAAFDEIIEKIKSAGGEITKDEETPLYDDIGSQEVELGQERVVEFSLPNKIEFQLIRKIETQRIEGAGKHKSLIPMEIPRVKMSLKKKAQFAADWETVDIDEMF